MIFIIDDDLTMAKCIKRACREHEVRIFSNAILAMDALSEELPEMIFLDVLLSGPDGFTFLNELVSYADTMKIPVVIVSSLNFKNQDLSEYGVVGILDKSTMRPEEIYSYAEKYARC